MTWPPQESLASLSLLAGGLFFLAVAAVLRWSRWQLSVLRDDETDLREYLANQSSWMSEEETSTQLGLQAGDRGLRGVHTSDSDVSRAVSLRGTQAKGAQTL